MDEKGKRNAIVHFLNGFYAFFMYAKTFLLLLEPSTCRKLRSMQFGGEGEEYFTYELILTMTMGYGLLSKLYIVLTQHGLANHNPDFYQSKHYYCIEIGYNYYFAVKVCKI